jgi:hypothetical protein
VKDEYCRTLLTVLGAEHTDGALEVIIAVPLERIVLVAADDSESKAW